MDVRCTKCGIEYEFDDAKVTAAGVTVKCTNCGHVFKVKREEQGSVPPSPSTSFQPQSTFAKGIDGGEWMVKRTDGQVFRFKELTTLQKWIVERKVGRDDEISKTGKTWKKLGEIAELASFFQVVDAANAALHASVIPVAPAMVRPPAPPGSGQGQGFVVVPGTNAGMPAIAAIAPAHIPPASTPAPPPAIPSSIHDLQTAQMPAQTGPLREQTAPFPPAAPRLPATAPATPQGAARNRPTTSPGGRPVPAPARAPTPGSSAAIDALDDDDPVLQMLRRRRRNAALAVILVLLVAGGVASALFWPQLSVAIGLAPAKVTSPAIDEAKKALRADRSDAMRAARQALASSKGSPAVAAWIVRLDVADAAHRGEMARLEDALAAAPGATPDHASNAKKLREEAGVTLATAYATLNTLRADNGLVEGHLASAAYQLERGALAEQRADLESARAAAKGDAAVDADIAAQQALADAHAGIVGDAKAALDKLPASDDGRLMYARAALAVAAAAQKPSDATLADAKKALATVPPDDERVALLAKLVEAVTPKAAAHIVDAGPAPVVAVVDAGVAVVAPKGNEPPAGTGAPKPKVGGVKGFLAAGWAALDGGKNGEAVKSFKKALELDENNAEAEFGLAEALRFSGAKEQALEAYKLYLKMAPNGKEAGTAKRAIEALQ